MLATCIPLLETAKLFSWELYHFTFSPTLYWCNFSAYWIFTNIFGVVTIFSCNHLDRCVMILHCKFSLHFMTNDVKHLYMCLLAIHISSSVKRLCMFFVHFLCQLVLYLYPFLLIVDFLFDLLRFLLLSLPFCLENFL